MRRIQGFAEQGGGRVLTEGMLSSTTTLVQRSFPGATVTVYMAGTTVLAPIYSDNQLPTPTPLANPFTANSNGFWFFYAAESNRYDVMLSGAGLTPWTLGDIYLPPDDFLVSHAGVPVTY